MGTAPPSLNLLPAPRRVVLKEGLNTSAPLLGINTAIDPSLPHPQGYRLSITPAGVRIVGRDEAGVFYGRQTYAQLTMQCTGGLPCLEIEDWPDFPVRGVMLDVSRDKVPTMQTLYALVDRLAGWKVNQLQLYTEHTFAYRDHRDVWKDASPITAEEMRRAGRVLPARFIELVPNQNSFGHMERWLKHPAYRAAGRGAGRRARRPGGSGGRGRSASARPTGGAWNCCAELYAELLPNFTSRLFNVGCDETFDVGQGRSKAEADANGATRVYLEFLQEVHALAAAHGRTMMFWGDIILHKPELIAELPAGVVALELGVRGRPPVRPRRGVVRGGGGAVLRLPGHGQLEQRRRPDRQHAGEPAVGRRDGLKHGAAGYLNTDWGDHGHLQYLPVSDAGFAAGAAFSWCLEANRGLDLPATLNAHAFHDPARALGKVACDLGNVYQAVGKLVPNASALFRVLVPSSRNGKPVEGITREGLRAAEGAIDAALSPLERARSSRPTRD